MARAVKVLLFNKTGAVIVSLGFEFSLLKSK